jgi:hypothetical protein
MNPIIWAGAAMAILIGTLVVTRAKRGSSLSLQAEPAKSDPGELPESPSPSPQPPWTRTLESGQASLKVKRTEERGASSRYRIEMQSPLAELRSIEVEIADWVPDTLVVDEDIRFLAFVREDEEQRDLWETRVHVVDLVSGKLSLRVEMAGRYDSAQFSKTELIVMTQSYTGKREERHDLPTV